ncbi:MAG: hypothetical protein NTZ78_00530 [Candidatus Aureabacteria bacterium]|nr:hypothetical protein [Candidatus Auribacterota bacterium]
MKKLLTIALSLLFAVCVSYTAVAGSLDSPGAPSAGSGMYTLQNLYDYLTSGTALTVQTGFQEPTAGPGSTMKTTKEIGDAVATPFALCATTTAADVKSGKPFFCTVSGSWGVQTGTGLMQPTPTIAPTITPTPTWGETRCLGKAGKWLPSYLPYPNDYGCWFIAANGDDNCNTVCTGKGLQCAAGNWTVGDETHCETCKALLENPAATCGSGGCTDGGPFTNFSHDFCWNRDPITCPKGCDQARGGYPELCICVP